jgi:hypothetical protein
MNIETRESGRKTITTFKMISIGLCTVLVIALLSAPLIMGSLIPPAEACVIDHGTGEVFCGAPAILAERYRSALNDQMFRQSMQAQFGGTWTNPGISSTGPMVNSAPWT